MTVKEQTKPRLHHHRWETVKVHPNGARTQRCCCKSFPECGAVRQVSPEGHQIALRANVSLDLLGNL
ncbi:MAG: hypothetical protein R6U89_10715 [Dehalococcoidia bacterium]